MPAAAEECKRLQVHIHPAGPALSTAEWKRNRCRGPVLPASAPEAETPVFPIAYGEADAARPGLPRVDHHPTGTGRRQRGCHGEDRPPPCSAHPAAAQAWPEGSCPIAFGRNGPVVCSRRGTPEAGSNRRIRRRGSASRPRCAPASARERPALEDGRTHGHNPLTSPASGQDISRRGQPAWKRRPAKGDPRAGAGARDTGTWKPRGPADGLAGGAPARHRPALIRAGRQPQHSPLIL